MSKNDAALLQVWTNTVLGEPFEPAQETVEGSSLLRRGENYGPQSIPDAVKLLTAGVDVQGDRIEVQILGFGAFEETWAVRYEVLPGDPAQRQVWDLLDNVLTEPYRTEAGRELRVRVTCVDSGGHHQHQVLSYCGSSQPRRAGDQGCRRAASDLAGTIKPDQDRRADFHDRRRYRQGRGLRPACESENPVPATSTSRSAARSMKPISRN